MKAYGDRHTYPYPYTVSLARSLWSAPRSLQRNDLTDKSVPALAAALAHLPNLKFLACDPHTLTPMVPLPLRQGPAGTQRCSCAVQPVSEVTRGALRGTRTHPSLCESPYVHCVVYRKGWL